MTRKPIPLKASKLCPVCNPKNFKFKTTDELAPLDGLIGQDRALDAIRMSAKIDHHDFNMYVMGVQGSGRRSAARELLSDEAGEKPIPEDWVYVNNFQNSHKPKALSLPPGEATGFKSAMESLVDDIANDIPAVFETEDYQMQRGSIEQTYSEEHEQTFNNFIKKAHDKGLAILRTPMGFAVATMRNGEILTPEQYDKLSTKERQLVDEAVSIAEQELKDVLKAFPKRQKAHRREIEELNASMAKQIVDVSIDEVLAKFGDLKLVASYLEDARIDLMENIELFLMIDPDATTDAFPVATTKHYAKPQFLRYAVNIMVSNSPDEMDGAPVVEEDLPTMANLVGRIEHLSTMGALVTDFTMIKPGALHRANGGNLIIEARQVLSEPLAWETLKNCLKTGMIPITSAGERLGLISTTSLEPDPIPLSVRVALIGERRLYFLLAALDPDFETLFKVQADFDDEVVLTKKTTQLYARLLGAIAKREGLKALSSDAVARMIQESARLAEDAERLSLNIDLLSNIMREADFWASEIGQKHIRETDIEKAIFEADRRANRIKGLSQEAITREILLIDTDGKKIGQINALSVIGMGSYRFGRPSRITARVRMGSGKLIDIEREVELGGPLHSKGVMILASYLATNYALDVPMSLWASIVFEQSYGGIDGDSASAAELFALLSALSGLPISQSFAVTGSVNQFGEIQAIGGVNEKIEGFFDICVSRQLSGQHGVIIPKANTKHLVLRRRVVDAVEQGKFNIIPIETIDQGIELLTGRKAGNRSKKGLFPKDTINRLVEDKLRSFANTRRAFATEKDDEDSSLPRESS
ncbi:MAG: peptidase [Hyphomicrobiales bacterium]|nr:MAG: peptidase [Hyphomicrobiales bacterium]